MNPWLVAESKWAREKALECRNRARQLGDPAWRRRRLTVIHDSERDLKELVRRHLKLISERYEIEDDEVRSELIARLERDAEHWDQIAVEQSARLEHNESYQGALVPDPSG
jgi:hypothetical protein